LTILGSFFFHLRGIDTLSLPGQVTQFIYAAIKIQQSGFDYQFLKFKKLIILLSTEGTALLSKVA
jgi:hypothetical protein